MARILNTFNPSKTDYYIPQSSKEITATASNNGLVTVVPATSPKGATRLILKAEDGTVLKEYRIFRNDEREKLVNLLLQKIVLKS